MLTVCRRGRDLKTLRPFYNDRRLGHRCAAIQSIEHSVVHPKLCIARGRYIRENAHLRSALTTVGQLGNNSPDQMFGIKEQSPWHIVR